MAKTKKTTRRGPVKSKAVTGRIHTTNTRTLLLFSITAAFILTVIGYGTWAVWQAHESAHASAYGALLVDDKSRITAYACRGTYNIRVTAIRHTSDVGVWMTYTQTNFRGSIAKSDGTYSENIYQNNSDSGWNPSTNLQQYLIGYKRGYSQYFIAMYYDHRVPGQRISLTGSYRGPREAGGGYEWPAGNYPTTDGLPAC